jgi:hypothetical protein
MDLWTKNDETWLFLSIIVVDKKKINKLTATLNMHDY